MKPTPMPDPSSSLRIAVLGAGKIGSAFAFQLARAGGHDVTVIARPGSVRLAQLEKDQAIVDVASERASVRVASRLDEETPYDLLIVTLLAHQTEPLLPALRRSASHRILFMFNTFQPEELQAAIGSGRTAFGMPFVQATLDADGRLKATIGAGGQKTIISEQACVELFNAAGLPAALEPNMPLWLRCHTPLCVAFESVSVAGERRGGGATWSESLALARGIHATFAVIKSLGYQVYPQSKRRLDASPPWVVAAVLWFMSRIRPFRQLLATGKVECAALVDVVLSAAPSETPLMLVSAIAAMKPS
jgi:2-dehydropantoate 2-reductase